MTSRSDALLLRRALAANIAFSGVSATTVVAAAPALSTHLDLSTTELVSLGVQLTIFAALIALVVTRRRLDRRPTLIAAGLISISDLGWAAGSAIALARGLAWTATGMALVLVATLGTGLLGAMQGRAVISLWRTRSAGAMDETPAPRATVRKRLARGAAIFAGIVALFGLLYLVLPWADLRSVDVRRSNTEVEASELGASGRELLLASARAHGLDAHRGYRTMEVVALDEWPGKSAWWPGTSQRFRAQRLLGTFTSRVELLDGPEAGAIWGLQSWQPYRRSSPTGELEQRQNDLAITFYLPTLQYFDELVFRLRAATIVVNAGPGEIAGERFDRVFATWESAVPHAGADQYELWLDPESHLVAKATYTLRDAPDLASRLMTPVMRFAAVGTIHYDDYREVEGVVVPFLQTVTIGTPRSAPASLDDGFAHRLKVEWVGFDTVEEEALLPIAGLPVPGDSKPG